MSEYRIFETEQFQDGFQKNLGPRQKNLKKKLRQYVYPQLTNQPYFEKNVKKLKGFKPEIWRYRIGDYRFFYEIDETNKIVFMLAVEIRLGSY